MRRKSRRRCAVNALRRDYSDRHTERLGKFGICRYIFAAKSGYSTVIGLFACWQRRCGSSRIGRKKQHFRVGYNLAATKRGGAHKRRFVIIIFGAVDMIKPHSVADHQNNIFIFAFNDTILRTTHNSISYQKFVPQSLQCHCLFIFVLNMPKIAMLTARFVTVIFLRFFELQIGHFGVLSIVVSMLFILVAFLYCEYCSNLFDCK